MVGDGMVIFGSRGGDRFEEFEVVDENSAGRESLPATCSDGGA